VEFISEEKVLAFFHSFSICFLLSDIRVCVQRDRGTRIHVDLVGLDGAERRGHHLFLFFFFRVATKGRHTIILLRIFCACVDSIFCAGG